MKNWCFITLVGMDIFQTWNSTFSISSCSCLCMTATANKITQKRIVKSLQLKKYSFINISPNRKNVKLHVSKSKTLYSEKELGWRLQSLREKNHVHEKTIIYCKSLKSISELYDYFIHELGDAAYTSKSEERTNEQLLVAMYHRRTLDH